MEEFSPAQQTMLALLRSSLWGDSFCPEFPDDTDWPAVYQELRHQTVEGLVIEDLIRLDPARKGGYFQQTTRKLSFFFSLIGVQQELCELLQSNGIPVAVLKGSAAAVYYPKPSYRTMGDIDLIVLPQDFDRANQLLSDHGCQAVDHDNYRHTEWRYKGILIELHRYFSVFKNDAISRQMDAIIYDGIPNADTISLENYSFPMLPRLANGIVLLEHISHHMEHGLGLRQIIDWMLFVDRELDDTWWHSEFRSAAQSIGLETLAITTTRMCQMYLGLRNDLTWCQPAEESLCHDLMGYVLEQGNFGRKKGTDHNKTIFVLTAASDLPHFLKLLHRHGLHNWKATQKHPWLRPFAGVYQVGRYIHLGLKRENPFQSFCTAAHQSRSQDEFFDRLGVVRRGKSPYSAIKTEH